MGLLSPEIGLDLGTNSVLIFVSGRGIVLREPSLVVVRGDKRREVVAVGEDALNMLGRMPAGYTALRPIQQGVVADFQMAVTMLRYFLRRAIGVNFIGKPKLLLTVPAEITAMERRAVEETVRVSGCRIVKVKEAGIAAAIGCGLPAYEPTGSMIVDIGSGTTEIGVVTMGELAVSRSVRIAGDALDGAIIEYLKREKNLLIGDRMAEDVKIDLGSAVINQEAAGIRRAMVRGRDMVTGLPQTMELDSVQVYEALQGPLREIVSAVVWVLERTSPELGADIMRNGIHLTGGCSQLNGLDQFIASETGIRVKRANNPIDNVVLGAGYMVTNRELIDRIGINHPFTE